MPPAQFGTPWSRSHGMVLLLAAGLAALTACGGRADLAPLLDPSLGAVPCSRNAAGRLLLEISNQGKRPSRASTTSVAFPVFEVRLPTRPLAPGEHTQLSLALPELCEEPGCDFTIWIDAKEEVRESNEDNNRATAKCPSP